MGMNSGYVFLDQGKKTKKMIFFVRGNKNRKEKKKITFTFI